MLQLLFRDWKISYVQLVQGSGSLMVQGFRVLVLGCGVFGHPGLSGFVLKFE